MKLKSLTVFILFIIFGNVNFSNAETPSEFINKITSEASSVLAEKDSKEKKIDKLKKIAENSVDIIGIGMYSLGSHRNTISDKDKDPLTFMPTTMIIDERWVRLWGLCLTLVMCTLI